MSSLITTVRRFLKENVCDNSKYVHGLKRRCKTEVPHPNIYYAKYINEKMQELITLFFVAI